MVRNTLFLATSGVGALTSEPELTFRYIQMTAYEADVQLSTVVAGQLAAATTCGGFVQLAMGSSLDVSEDVAAGYGLGTPGWPPLGFKYSAEFVPGFTKVVDFRSEQHFVDHIACLKPIIANYSREGETWKSKFQYHVQSPAAFTANTLISVEELFWAHGGGRNSSQDAADVNNEFNKAYDGLRAPQWHAHGVQLQGMVDPGYTGFVQAGFGSVTAYVNEEQIRSDYAERRLRFGRINDIVAQACTLPAVSAAVFNATWVLQGEEPFVLV